jgi:glycine hydroxymethyltransferase
MTQFREPSIFEVDPEVAQIIENEKEEQRNTLRLIPSENYASAAVMSATGSCLTNKYSEGYATKRYYQGQTFIDQVELLAINRAKALFGADHVNVQPYSGSPANLAVYFAMLQPGDTILSLSLPHGGHLTHGWKVTISGQYYKVVHYGVRPDNHRIDMDEVAKLAREHQPKIIICGASAYPRIIDFPAFAQIAQEVGAYLLADIAHISGLVAGKVHPSPVPYADIVSTTTHKTLRGPRGGMIMCKAEHAARIDKAVFPGCQGGPHNHTTAALAVALKEASSPDFEKYAQKVVNNAQVLAQALLDEDFDLISGGTENHLLLIDLTKTGIGGRKAAASLEKAGIVCNANSIPFDPKGAFNPSGIRVGTPSLTTRGMGASEMKQLGKWMKAALSVVDDDAALARIAQEVKVLCDQFPAPGVHI